MADKRSAADIAFIEELAKMLNAHDLAEVEVSREFGKDDELHVRLSKVGGTVVAAPTTPTAPLALPAASEPTKPAAQNAPASAAKTAENHPGVVTSPMVGTVYLQAEPGAAPFATVGAAVNEGDTLLIVEAMKTMNHIQAPKSGKVVEVLVADGDAVEFGAPLVIVE